MAWPHENEPSGQAVHSVASCVLENVPDAHGSQRPPSTHVPGAHGSVQHDTCGSVPIGTDCDNLVMNVVPGVQAWPLCAFHAAQLLSQQLAWLSAGDWPNTDSVLVSSL